MFEGDFLKSIDWRASAELVGLAAIVVSLVFVGLELRQSQKIALAAQYQARTESGREFFYQSLASDYRIDDAAKEIESWEWPAGFLSADEAQWLDEHTSSDSAEAAYWAVINLYGFDNYYFQYQSGLLSEEAWIGLQSRLRGTLRDSPFARYMIVVAGQDFRESFVFMSKSLIADIDSN
jgi:hypothetical protein